MDNFLPEKLVMVDCEFSGLDPKKDDLLQVAMVKLQLVGDQYEALDEPLNVFLKSNLRPTRPFHHEFLTHVFDACNESEITCVDLKEIIHDWMGSDWVGVTPCGECVPCDIEFLYVKDCLDRPGFDEDDQPLKGTFHYEYFDLNAPKLIARHRYGEKLKPSNLDEDNIHDALVDCYNQLKELNFYLTKLLK